MAHILVATDGTLDPEKAVAMVTRLHEPGDDVTIVTAVKYPREFLRGVAATTGVAEVAAFAHEAGPGVLGIAGGAKAAERLAAAAGSHSGPDDHPLGDYFQDTARERTDPLRNRLADEGVDAAALWTTTEDQTARTILDVAEKCGADVLVIGSHGRGRFEGPLGSTVTKIVRRADLPVVVVK